MLCQLTKMLYAVSLSHIKLFPKLLNDIPVLLKCKKQNFYIVASLC